MASKTTDSPKNASKPALGSANKTPRAPIPSPKRAFGFANKAAQSRQIPSKPARGFTFTLSVVIIAATIIAIAAFASEWRRGQEEAASSTLPITESARIEKRVASDMQELLGTGAKIEQNSSEATVTLQLKLPLSREGLPIADLASYSGQLQQLYRELSTFEVSLSAPWISGQRATVLLLPGSSNITLDNNGPYDTVTYSFVSMPKKIEYSLTCMKQDGSVGALSEAYGAGSGNNVTYNSTYYAANGSILQSGLVASPQGEVDYSLNFEDLTAFDTNSTIGAFGGRITLKYTKSPSSRLVLPLDENASTVGGSVRDYSLFETNFTLGNASAAPKWVPDCHAGGCYYFDGSDDTIVGPNLELEVKDSVSVNINLLRNPDFENYSLTGPTKGDRVPTWANWSYYIDPDYSEHVDFTSVGSPVQSGLLSVRAKATKDAGTYTSWFNQSVFVPANESGLYLLSFWFNPNGEVQGHYRLSDMTLGTYLQDDGTWSSDPTPLEMPGLSNSWEYLEKNFVLSSVDHRINLEFFQPYDVGSYYFDNSSIIKISTLNWGFEYDDGSLGILNWVVDHGGTFSQSSPAKSGTHCLALNNDAGQSDSFIYTILSGIQNNAKYSVEFWARSDGAPNSSARYQIYDVGNGKYLHQNGSWVGSPTTLDPNITSSSSYSKVVKNFQTLPGNVSTLQMRFVVPSAASHPSCVDDFYIQEVGDFTLSAWIKIANPGTNRTILCQYTPSPAGRYGFGFLLDSLGNATMALYSNSQNGLAPSPPDNVSPNISIYDSRWHLLALSVNRSYNYSAYLDGAKFDTGRLETSGIGMLNSTSPFYIGACGSNTSFNGSLDDLRVYHRALGDSEIYKLYHDRTQDVCSLQLMLTYNRSSLPPSLSSTYNADLRIRYDLKDSSLLAHYNLDDGKGNVTSDSSGNNLHGTALGGTWQPNGTQSGALYFNGLADWAYTPAMPIGNHFSVSAWVRANGTPQASYARIAENGMSTHFYLGTTITGSAYQFVVRSSTPPYGNVAGGTVLSGGWQFLAGTFDGSNGILYINGTSVANGTFTSPPITNLPIHIGTSASVPGSNSWKGDMDDIRIYNRTLSAHEVKLLYLDSLALYNGKVKASSG